MKKRWFLCLIFIIAIVSVNLFIGCPISITTGPSFFVKSVTPVNGSRDIALDTTIIINFSEEVDTSGPGRVEVGITGDASLDIANSYWDKMEKELTIQLTNSLETSTKYNISVLQYKSSSQDTIATYSSSFTTADTDIYAPKIVSTSPSFNELVTILNPLDFTITFNEPIQITGSEDVSFEVGGGGIPTLSSPVWSNNNKTVSYTVAGSFVNEKVYLVKTTNIKDSANNISTDTVTLFTPYYLTFTGSSYTGTNYPDNKDDITDDMIIKSTNNFTVYIKTNSRSWFKNLSNSTISAKIDGNSRTCTAALYESDTSLGVTISPLIADMSKDTYFDIDIDIKDLRLQTDERIYILNNWVETFKLRQGNHITLRIEDAVYEGSGAYPEGTPITDTQVWLTGDFGQNTWNPEDPSETLYIGADQSGEAVMEEWNAGTTLKVKCSTVKAVWDGGDTSFNSNLLKTFGAPGYNDLELTIPQGTIMVIVNSNSGSIQYISE